MESKCLCIILYVDKQTEVTLRGGSGKLYYAFLSLQTHDDFDAANPEIQNIIRIPRSAAVVQYYGWFQVGKWAIVGMETATKSSRDTAILYPPLALQLAIAVAYTWATSLGQFVPIHFAQSSISVTLLHIQRFPIWAQGFSYPSGSRRIANMRDNYHILLGISPETTGAGGPLCDAAIHSSNVIPG